MTTRRLYSRCQLILLFCLLTGIPGGGRVLRAEEIVRQVQEELRKRHLYFGDIDGQMSSALGAALRRYQGRKGFPATGAADETTLRSLTLLPPSPTDRIAYTLPDTTVLRSDQGMDAEHPAGAGVDNNNSNDSIPGPLDSPPPPEPAATATPPLRPFPPAAAVARQPPPVDETEIRAFIGRYLQAGQSNDLPAELRFYGDRVAYFDDGTVDRHYIEQDVKRYEHRWPDRVFTVTGPMTVAPSPDGDPAKVQVRFRYRFHVKGSRLSADGLADNEYIVAGSRPEDLRIISMKEQRVRP